MLRSSLAAAIALITFSALIALAGGFAAAPPVAAQSESESVEVRIAARKAADGRVEMCIQINADQQRRCPGARHFPYLEMAVDEWRASSVVRVGRAVLGVRARRAAGGWVELALTATVDGQTRIYRPERRFFNWQNTAVDRWLRSSSVSVRTDGCALPTGLAADAPRLQRGRPAPDFALQRFEDECAVSLSDLRGRTVLLAFWSSWDPAGQTLLRRLDSLRRAQGGARGDLAVLAINVYDAAGAAARAFVEAGVGFQSVLDAGAEVARHYRIDGLPELLLIDADGVFRERITGAADLAAIQAALDATTAAADSAAGRHTGGPLP